MYEYQLKDMAALVATELGLDDAGRKRVQDVLAGYWYDKIALVWTIDDVRDCKEEISDEEAVEVLQTVLHSHDGSCGVNWDTIVGACGGSYPDADKDDDEDVDEGG